MSFLTTSAVLVFLSCGVAPQADVAVERVDLVEVNHFFDDQGRHVFDQMIFYDWSQDVGRYQVRAWRLVKSPTQFPQRDWEQGNYLSIWQDGEVLRKIRAASARESWTQYDPELVEREYLPKELRRDLYQPRTAKRER